MTRAGEKPLAGSGVSPDKVSRSIEHVGDIDRFGLRDPSIDHELTDLARLQSRPRLDRLRPGGSAEDAGLVRRLANWLEKLRQRYGRHDRARTSEGLAPPGSPLWV